MINQEPVPEGLLERALHTAFTTDEWPEWDNLDIVPTTDEPFDLDAFNPFAGEEDTDSTGSTITDTESIESPESDSDSDSDSEDSSDSPVLDYPDLGADLGSDFSSDFGSDFSSGFDSDSPGNYDM